MATKKPKNSKKKTGQEGTDIPLANIPDRMRRAYTDDFKTKAAQRIIGGESPQAVAEELDLSRSLVTKWVARLKAGQPITEPRGVYNRTPKAGAPSDVAGVLRDALVRSQRARDERLEAAAMIVAADIGGKDGESIAKQIRARKTAT